MVDIVMHLERGLLQDGRTAQEFLEEQFEYEYCTECDGDVEDHIVVIDVLGLFHARCSLSLRARLPGHSGYPNPKAAPAATPLCCNSSLISRAVSSRSA
jgi:hypothetical protein